MELKCYNLSHLNHYNISHWRSHQGQSNHIKLPKGMGCVGSRFTIPQEDTALIPSLMTQHIKSGSNFKFNVSQSQEHH